jgi:hypothetical protein
MASTIAQQNNYVDWHVYERDLARVERQFEQLYGRLDRLAKVLEDNATRDKRNNTMLRAEWIRLLGAFVAGSLPTILVVLLNGN